MRKPGWDFTLLFQILAIGAISLLVIFSQNRELAQNQLVFWMAGGALLLFFTLFDWRLWTSFSTPFYLISIIALLALLFTADPVRGSVRWIDLGAFRIQPSEIAKVASILALANFFREKTANNLKNVFISFLIILPAAILTLIEPDIGNSLSFFAIWLGIVLIAGLRPFHLITGALAAGISLFLIFEMLAPYQKARIESFVNPANDPAGTGYQLIQSKIAVGSGQMFGRGIGRGPQSQLKFLPEAESDFIFASIVEQLGFVGGAFIVIVYSFFIKRVFVLHKLSENFPALIAAGATSFLLFQFLINVGMNLGLVPVTGITFPLVSYGGSSLISTLILLGIIFSIKRSNVDAYE